MWVPSKTKDNILTFKWTQMASLLPNSIKSSKNGLKTITKTTSTKRRKIKQHGSEKLPLIKFPIAPTFLSDQYFPVRFQWNDRTFFFIFYSFQYGEIYVDVKIAVFSFFVETADRVYPLSKLNIKLFVHKGWWCFFFSKDGGVGYPRGLERTASKGWEKRHKGK